MAHPQACHDPDCRLSYVEHLRGFGVSAAAMPSRMPDTAQAIVREKRWDRDHAAYARLAKEGNEPRQLDGARFIERNAETEDQVTKSVVKVDYDDPT